MATFLLELYIRIIGLSANNTDTEKRQTQTQITSQPLETTPIIYTLFSKPGGTQLRR